MRAWRVALLAGLLALALRAGAADETAAKVAAQKKAAAAAWEAVEAGPLATAETKHLLIYAPTGMGKRLKEVGTLLERYHDLAARALGYDGKEEIYPGKVAVFLFPERSLLPAFARRIEKRRPAAGETGSFSASDDRLHVAAAVPEGKKGPSVEMRAGEQLAALLLTRKAGRATPLPDWLVAGFGRATSYRAAPRERGVLEDRKRARLLAARRKAGDVWSAELEPDEAGPLQGSVADFLAYSPYGKRFGKFVVGFRPEEGMMSRTTAQAIEAAGWRADTIENFWRRWVVSPR
jgi:hypothetical protein